MQHYFHLRTVTFQKEKHLSFSYFVFLCLSALLRTQSLSSQAFEILNDSPHQNSNILPSWSWASRFPDGHWIIVWNPIIIDSLHGSVKIVKNRKCICDILATLYGICNHTPGPESFPLSLIDCFILWSQTYSGIISILYLKIVFGTTDTERKGVGLDSKIFRFWLKWQEPACRVVSWMWSEC